jgi:2-oxoglutarate dehydrogenase complex dehydrogenase (E1) component-like enzyme
MNKKSATIEEIHEFLQNTYSNKIAYQFSHLEVKN